MAGSKADTVPVHSYTVVLADSTVVDDIVDTGDIVGTFLEGTVDADVFVVVGVVVQ